MQYSSVVLKKSVDIPHQSIRLKKHKILIILKKYFAKNRTHS